MMRIEKKHRKKLARLVLAALLCTGGASGFISPSLAEASELTVTGYTSGVGFLPDSTKMVATGYYRTLYIPAEETVDTLILTGDDWDAVAGSIDVAGRYADEASGYTVKMTGANVQVGDVSGGIGIGDASGDIPAGNASGNNVEISAGKVKGDVSGGVSDYGSADNNTVTISGGTVGNSKDTEDSYIYGGASEYGEASNNTVTIKGDAKVYTDAVVGGYNYYAYADAADANNNTVTINAKGAEVGKVYSGLTNQGNANKNTVTINDGSVTGEVDYGKYGLATIVGGYTYNGNATDNTVIISGGQINGSPFEVMGNEYGPGMVVGGFASGGEASNNTVIISGGTLGGESISPLGDDTNNDDNRGGETAEAPAIVIGGFSTQKANNNTVTISGGDIKDGVLIVGGMVLPTLEGEEDTSDTTGYEANNNTVNILTPINANYLIGGLDSTSESVNAGSGNTLNIAAKNVTTNAVGGFQNMNFYLPSDIANGDTMLTIKGIEEWSEYVNGEPAEGATKEIYGNDLQGVTFGVAALSGVNLEVGNTVNLVVGEQGLVTDNALKTTSSEELAKAEFLAPNNLATDKRYELSISKKGADTILATVDNITEEGESADRLKSPVETRAGVATMINAGTDLLVGAGLQNAADAAATGGGSAPFAAMSGSSLRAESGSHVDSKGFGLALGFAKEIENKSGKLLIGPVMEYGHGKYDSYQDSGIKADGKASYWGLGVMARQTNNNGFYYEGSLRAGRAKSDYSSDLSTATHASYDSTATYWAAHLGVGKLVDVGKDNTLDIYGKYLYSRTGGDSTTIYMTGGGKQDVDFDAVNSHRLRAGARLTHVLNEQNKVYGGLAYQYEFKGEARATYQGLGAAPSPSVKGSSGMLELGWQVKPGKKNPMVIDLGVTGWVGKQRGVTANLQANWTF
ncbi:MAG: autotransporter outer membrane beta-barrel domain-containing protein [Acidaminococcaceae bacterium]|nr:autotransporter outer membrane beta-barrel domain-containing protein [Acidaminococcaceae bacterium]